MGGHLNWFLVIIIVVNTQYTFADFICTDAGRFANPDDRNCQSYYLCTLRWDGSFTSRLYSCPGTSTFDPDIRQCSLSHTCPTPPECVAAGRFPDITDEYCSRYYLCTSLRNGSFIQTFYNCPNSRFDPYLQICSENYVCPHTTVTTDHIYTTRYYDFHCDAQGRFANNNDYQCQSYWLCTKLRNGTFIQNPYKCPGNSVFDSSCHMCSILIECPTRSI